MKIFPVIKKVTAAELAIGPSYGQSAGDDASTFDVTIAIDLAEVNLNGGLDVTAALDLASVNPNYSGIFDVTAAMDLAEVNLNGGLDIRAALDGSVVVDGMLSDEDTYLERDAGDTINGADTVLEAKNNTAVVNDDNKAYIAWDLTSFSTGTVTAATMNLSLAEDNAAGGDTARIEIYTNAAKPFEEDTATWNNTEPPPGTLRQTIDEAVNGAALTQHALTLDATVRANMLGNWLYARILGTANGLGGVIITAGSKENGTVANRPTLDISLNL